MKTILTINAGSSSVKACLFLPNGTREVFKYANVNDYVSTFYDILAKLNGKIPDIIGHRVVHSGDITDMARLIDSKELERLHSITYLAPLHMPANIHGIKMAQRVFPTATQIACFDTAFHTHMLESAKTLPLPKELGFKKYGFHGLSYAYISSKLIKYIPDSKVSGYSVVVCHLGSGASLCLLEDGMPIDTTMGFTPAGGIPMGTRPGDIDPGILIELSKKYTPAEVSDIIFKKSGLLALSDGQSNDMATLLETYNTSTVSRRAIQYFCREVRGAIGSFAGKYGYIDAIVFTGGIGENSELIKDMIAKPLRNTLGIKTVVTIPTDEELQIKILCEELK